MSESLSRLMQMNLPTGPREPKDWQLVKERLGTALPADYTKFIDTYGGGRFDNYLWVLEPDCPNRNYDLLRHHDERREAFDMLWDDGEEKPAELTVEGTDIIPWATTDNGEFIFWLVTQGTPPDQWTVMVNEARGEEWEHFPSGFADFLTGTLTGRITSNILSDQFPTAVHEFRPSGSF